MPCYEDSYLGQLRRIVGNRKLISVGARAIIRDDRGRVLFVRRKDKNTWAMPAGSLELDESILDCLKREVKEETGLDPIAATSIAIYSEPRFSFTTAYGDPYQLFAVVFLIDRWSGVLRTQTNETVEARFFNTDALPQTPDLYRETLADLQTYDGRMILK